MAARLLSEWNQDATVYVGALDEKVSKPLLWELFLQAGPVVNTNMPKDSVTGQHQCYSFVEFLSEKDADNAIKIMNMIKLDGKPTRVNKASAHNKNLDVGANIFIGNLDPKTDKLLYDTFSTFGDPDTGNSKDYAFINFVSFDALDVANEAMDRQYFCNHPITVSYAFKKDSKGERHGSGTKQLLAAQNPLSQADHPRQLFADATPPLSAPNPVVSSLGSGLPLPALPPEIPPPMPPPPMPPGAGGHGSPSAGTPGAGHPRHGHSHPHPLPLGGIPHPGMNPHAGPPGSGGQPPPRPPPRMPHPGPSPVGPMPLHGMHGPPPLMPSHGYTGPPRPPPYSYQQRPLPSPRPTPQPPVPPQGPL
ncbi:hypothetical protein FD754_011650 [Muntiacus muntjak]|uniref:RRM domain-containing protein n=1 Tax=Muntiacus muntjak TaxID=9888 RepID=A0A5N3VCT1_MUNMU|nr:hypothetical protein FD754_011650 [Muntiacus muntjak]